MPTVTDVCGPPANASAVCRLTYDVTGKPELARLAEVVIAKPLEIVLVVAAAILANRLVHRAIRRSLLRLQRDQAVRDEGGADDDVRARRRVQRATTIGALLRSMATFAIWSLAVLTVLGELGLNLGPLIAGAGIVGVAVGFGAQNLVKDFLSGIFMLIEDQFGVGDVIDVGDATGTVESVSLRTTRVRSVDGTVWYVPNGAINRVGNKSQQWSRVVLDIAVAYATELDEAVGAIRRAALDVWREQEIGRCMLEEPEILGVEDVGADGVVIRLVVKTAPVEQWRVARALRAAIKASFDAAGIKAPVPQRVVTTLD